MLAYTSLAAGAFFYAFIVLCFGKNAAKQDAVRKRLNTLEKSSAQLSLMGDDEMSKPFAERVLRPLIHRLVRLLPVGNRGSRSSNAEKQKKLLQQAGWAISVEEYSVLQLIILACSAVLGLGLGLLAKESLTNLLLYFLMGAFAGYAVLRYVCAAAGTKRKAAIEKQLPDLLDLLSISVAAGLGFERAIGHIIDTMDGPLIDEFAVAYREMSMGRTRKEALSLLGERCGVEELSSVTSALVQAGQLGIPIGNVLQSQAAAIRRSRRSKVQEKAAKISTKILFPMLFLIFPVLLIVLLGPSVITIMEQFG